MPMSEILPKKYGWLPDKAELSHNFLLRPSIKILKKYKVKSILNFGTHNGATNYIRLFEGLKLSAMEPDKEGFIFSRQNREADIRRLSVGDSFPKE
jgi:hypothetical protein